MHRRNLLAAAVALLTVGCSSTASPPVRTIRVPRAARAPSWSAQNSAAVRAHYASGSRGNGRGRGGGGLPPGIAKNLARGKPLPPGIAKQALPADLLRSLPPAGRGLEYLIVAGKLLVVETATQIVREILMDVVF